MFRALGRDPLPTLSQARGSWDLGEVHAARLSDAWPFVPPPEVRLMRDVASQDGATSHWGFNERSPSMVVADKFTSDTRSEYDGWSVGTQGTGSWTHDAVNEWMEIRTADNVGFGIGQDAAIPDAGYARFDFIKRADFPTDNSHSFRVFNPNGDYYNFSFSGSQYSSQGVHRNVDGTVVDTAVSTAGTIDSEGTVFVIECYWSPERLRLKVDGVELFNLPLTGPVGNLVRWELYTSQANIDLMAVVVGAGEPLELAVDTIGSVDLAHSSLAPVFAKSLLAAEPGQSFQGPPVSAFTPDNRIVDLTWELWVEWDGVATNCDLMYNGDIASTGYGLRVSDGATGAGGIIALPFGGSDENALNVDYELPIGITHVVLTRDASTWRLHLDSVEVATASATPNVIDVNDPFLLGGNDHIKIDAVSFYPFVLGVPEIQDHFYVGSGLWKPPLRWSPFSPVEFTPTSSGRTGTIQTWEAPVTAMYRITAKGAQGGGSSGGLGANLSGDFSISKGTVLSILVGQRGTWTGNSVAGGGGTFVVESATGTPLVVAGGGGGSAGTYSEFRHASLGMDGNPGQGGSAGAAGGTGGGGGSATARGAGGGGLTGNGQSSTQTSARAVGGLSFINGGLGGSHDDTGDEGGFGGGGAVWSTGWRGGGGGGGYSGGGGSTVENTGIGTSGGGGGSFNDGSAPSSAVDNEGDGFVSIE